MKKIKPFILITLISLCLPLACSSKTSMMNTVEELGQAIQTAIQEGSIEKLKATMYLKDTLPEFTQGLPNMIQMFAGPDSKFEKLEILDWSQYKPSVPTPTNFNGKDLEWNLKPSHWIVLHFKAKDGSGTSSLEFPAGKLDTTWKVATLKYKN